MHRFQQRQWLQRQQMQEEQEREERERRRMAEQGQSIDMTPEHRSALHSAYHQQQAQTQTALRLLNPTDYHLQQTVGRTFSTSLVDAAPAVPIKTEPDVFLGQGPNPFGQDPSIMDPGFLPHVSGGAMEDLPSPTSSVDLGSPEAAGDPMGFLDLDDGREAYAQAGMVVPGHRTSSEESRLAAHSMPSVLPSAMAQPFTPPQPNRHMPVNAGAVDGAAYTAPSFSFQFSATPSSLPNNAFSIDASKSDDYAAEKRRRRRESHNAVERRRRDNINDRITELSMLVPDCVEESNPSLKPNKGIILRKSADYIRYLQEANRRLQKQIALANGGELPAQVMSELEGLNRSFLSQSAADMDDDGDD